MSAAAKAALISEIYRSARDFFYDLKYVEVAAPHIVECTVTDPHIESIQVDKSPATQASGVKDCFLHTSSEFFQKKLLAAGVQDNFTLGKVFRADEQGRHHREEFSMCEWYRVGGTLEQMTQEAVDLVFMLFKRFGLGQLDNILSTISFDDAVREITGIDISIRQLGTDSEKKQFTNQLVEYACDQCGFQAKTKMVHDRTDLIQLIDLIFSMKVQPCLKGVTIVKNFPYEHAALAQVVQDKNGYEYALRSEVYVQTPHAVLELANGYQEMNDAIELRRRFNEDNRIRQASGKNLVHPDQHLITAAEKGIPDCAGIALGFERLLMVLTNVRAIEELSLL